MNKYMISLMILKLFQEAEEVFATTLDDLEREAKAQNIEIFNRQLFKDDPSAAVANLKRQVRPTTFVLFYKLADDKNNQI